MSHQNTDDENTIKSESIPKTDREMAVALRAMALATQDPSPIFQLNVDCWEEIFDWLSFDDLHSFGQTCKFYYRIAGKYFEWKYRGFWFRVWNNEMDNFCWNHLSGFNEFAQRLYFCLNKPNRSLLFARANCKSPNELCFVGRKTKGRKMYRLEKMLANVEIVTFNLDNSDEFMESILELCATTLKRMTIGESTGCEWMHHKYPKLEHLELYEVNSARELVQFFEANANVRSFSTVAEDILKYRKEFMASTIELDDLTVRGETTLDGISNALVDLYNRGFYKRLHFTTCSKKHLADLPGLTTLLVTTDNYIDLPYLPTVTRLAFRPFWDGLGNWLNMDEVTDALPNLKYILIDYHFNMRFIMSFIRNSKRLKVIKIPYFRNDHNDDIDPVLMNREREKLNVAHKVTIFVEEKDYLRIKWTYSRSDFGPIEIRRSESYDSALDFNFF